MISEKKKVVINIKVRSVLGNEQAGVEKIEK